MLIRAGYELDYAFPKPTPLILTLHIHSSRVADFVRPDYLTTVPAVSTSSYHDGFGNCCTRLVAPQGKLRLSTDALLQDAGTADLQTPDAHQHAVQDLPEETLVYLLGSRYCETDRLSEIAWSLFAATPSGWARVQAICNFVHAHVQFGYQHASPTKTALQVYNDRRGVCRDFAHLAIAFCRCMNIPARYCTGYLADIGVPVTEGDFAGWFEAFLGGRWHTFDPRNNKPRIGRILMARGRDAADVAISTAFGENTLENFRVWTEEVV
jgi:transglutaminase-like putative cysteine protease